MDNAMQTYKVTIDFRKGPSFSSEALASNEVSAEVFVLRSARANGFNEAVKKDGYTTYRVADEGVSNELHCKH